MYYWTAVGCGANPGTGTGLIAGFDISSVGSVLAGFTGSLNIWEFGEIIVAASLNRSFSVRINDLNGCTPPEPPQDVPFLIVPERQKDVVLEHWGPGHVMTYELSGTINNIMGIKTYERVAGPPDQAECGRELKRWVEEREWKITPTLSLPLSPYGGSLDLGLEERGLNTGFFVYDKERLHYKLWFGQKWKRWITPTSARFTGTVKTTITYTDPPFLTQHLRTASYNNQELSILLPGKDWDSYWGTTCTVDCCPNFPE